MHDNGSRSSQATAAEDKSDAAAGDREALLLLRGLSALEARCEALLARWQAGEGADLASQRALFMAAMRLRSALWPVVAGIDPRGADEGAI